MGSFGTAPASQDGVPLSSAWSEANNSLLPIRGIYEHTDSNGNTTLIIEVAPVQADTPTLANVSASASSVTLFAANTAAKGRILFNDSASALYLKYGSTASATSCTYKIPANSNWEMPPSPVYTGIITGIWDTATGNARITELS